MNTNLVRLFIRQLPILVWVLSVAIGSSSALSQSTVFMTIESSISSGRLARFDGTTETYEVDDGAGGLYYGVTILNDEVLVADLGAEKIQRFSLGGAYLGTFGPPSVKPAFLETDRSGNVYSTPSVIGPAVGTRMTSVGVVSQTFSGSGTLQGIDADAAGNVYIAENGGPDILRKYASNGTLVNSTPLGLINAKDLAIDEVGNRLFIADEGSSPNPSAIRIFDITGAAPVLTGSILAPSGVNFIGVHYAPESGHIFTADFGLLSGAPRGYEYTADGTFVRLYKPTSQFHAWDITTYVPEPSSVTLITMATVGFVLRSRKAR